MTDPRDQSPKRFTHQRRGGAADPAVTRLLRDAYAPPADPGYWDGLEARIMARVRTARASGAAAIAPAVEWWQVMSGWVVAGAWAVGLAAAIAGAAVLQSRAAERRVAYEALLQSGAVATVTGQPGPDERVAAAARGDAAHGRDAALRYVLSPR